MSLLHISVAYLVVIATQSVSRLVKDFLAAKVLSFFVDIIRLD